MLLKQPDSRLSPLAGQNKQMHFNLCKQAKGVTCPQSDQWNTEIQFCGLGTIAQFFKRHIRLIYIHLFIFGTAYEVPSA